MAETLETERIKELFKLCKSHFGDVKFVGIKYHKKIGWLATAEFDGEFENLTADGDDSIDALKKLKKRIQKIIKRYSVV